MNKKIILENCACLAIEIKCLHKLIFLVKLFDTCKLSDGSGVWLLQHVNYVSVDSKIDENRRKQKL